MADPITWPKPNIPVKRKTFAQPEVLTALQKSELRKLNPIFTDSQYVACTRAEWQAVLTEANTKALEYVPEVHDCDDFGALARGLVPAISDVNGIAWVLDPSSQHSYNAVLVLEDDGSVTVAVVEPQLDEFVQGGSGHYKGADGWIVW